MRTPRLDHEPATRGATGWCLYLVSVSVRSLIANPASRRYLAAHTQSSIGDGIGYVALVLLAVSRFDSPWAVTLILLADLVPAVSFGLWFGALADRMPRRNLAVCADIVRAVAFGSIVFVDSYAATFVCAALAGVGTAMYRPAVSSSLRTIAPPGGFAAITSAHRGIKDAGLALGPALAAGLLLVSSLDVLLAINAVSFAVSASLLAGVPMGQSGAKPDEAPDDDDGPRDDGTVRIGLRLASRIPGVLALVVTGAVGVLLAGGLSVAEPLLATKELGVGAAGFAVLVSCYGIGQVGGALLGVRERSLQAVRARYLMGIAVAGGGLLLMAGTQALAVGMMAFALTGVGNSMLLVHDQQLVTRLVPGAMLGRVFGARDTLDSAAFVASIVAAGALIGLFGVRALLAGAGVGMLCVGAAATTRLRGLRDA